MFKARLVPIGVPPLQSSSTLLSSALRRHHPAPYLNITNKSTCDLPRTYFTFLSTSTNHNRQSTRPALVRPFHTTRRALDQLKNADSTTEEGQQASASAAKMSGDRNTKGDHNLKEVPKEQVDDWKNRPPYRTTEDNSQFEKKYTAHCHCGRIKYWLSREKPLAAKFCHCIDCQSLHGAPFQWAAIFEKRDLHFEHGAEGLAFYHSGTKGTDYQLPIKVSCSYCHAPIMDEGRNMVLMFPAIIKFGDPEHKKHFDPQCHIFYSQRVVDMPDGKPKWTRLDNDSELMKDVDYKDMESVVGHRKVETVDE